MRLQTGPPSQGHLDRIRELARIQHANPSATKVQLAQIEAYAAEAAALGCRGVGRAQPDKGHRSRGARSVGAGLGDGRRPATPNPGGSSPSSTSRRDEICRRDAARGDPEAYQDETESPGLPKGIPIYVDPVGLSQADKTMTSTVRNLDLEGVPLRRTLQLALAQLDMIYFVEDGMLFITSQRSRGRALPPGEDCSHRF